MSRKVTAGGGAILHRKISKAPWVVFLLGLGLSTGAVQAQPVGDASSGKRVALLIGNAIYLDGNTPIPTALHDVRALAAELRRSDFDVQLAENVTREDMRRVFDAFLAKIGPGTAALFYFNGFATQIVHQNFLIPVDAQIRSEAEAKRDGFELESIFSRMADKGARVKIAIIDASRRNPYESRFRSFFAGLATINPPDGTLAIYAASPGKVVSDGNGPTSVFMEQLLMQIRNSDTAEAAFRKAALAVSVASAQEQIPWVFSSLNDDFYFSRSRAIPPSNLSRAPSTATPPFVSPAPAPVRPPSPPVERPASAVPPPAPARSNAPGQMSSVRVPSAPPSGGSEVFRDCPDCPDMIIIPAGSFDMGGSEAPFDRPIHRVTIARPFALSRYEITFEDWDHCVEANGCRYRPDDRGRGRGQNPATNLSWLDVKEYVAWLSRKTGQRYRLPSEAEWEYAARGGTQTRFYWGALAGARMANCRDCQTGGGVGPMPVGSFPANPFGLYDISGNAAEWVEDCWNENYNGAPSDGSAWTTGNCSLRVLRGGSFDSQSNYLLSSARFRYDADVRYFANGARVAREVP